MNETINTKEVETLFNLGAHLGHKKNRLHPKAKKYVYKMVDGVSVIDLTKTVGLLEQAKKVLKQARIDGKKILVVATKKVASQFASDLCKSNDIPYMTTKWLAGLLTNFNSIILNVKKYETMKQQKDNGEWDQFVKHERFQLAKELARLERLYGGLPSLKEKPDLLLVIDIKKEKNSVVEAKANGIPVVALVDTNSNPDEVDYPVIANDDSPTVVEYIMNQLIHAYMDDNTKQPAKAPAAKAETKKEEQPAEKVEKKVEAKEEKTEKPKVTKEKKETKPAAKPKKTAKKK